MTAGAYLLPTVLVPVGVSTIRVQYRRVRQTTLPHTGATRNYHPASIGVTSAIVPVDKESPVFDATRPLADGK